MRVVAVDIGGTNTKICICDEHGRIDQFTEYETESHKGGPFVISKLIDQITKYEGFDAIAVSTAGQVNAEEGYIIYANENIPAYTGMRIKGQLEERFHVPVKVENDVNAAALGEAFFGANRTIYKGANGVAAEFGHMFTHPQGDAPLGGKPYYESFASTTALVRNARRVDPDCVNGRILFGKVKQGDQSLRAVLDAWIDEVSLGLASLIHIFNPAAVIVGGGVMEQEELVQLIENRTKSLIMPSFADVSILKASLGNKAGVLGALSLYLDDQK